MKMNSIEYDLDTSGGLMPQIQAIIAPPASEETNKRLKKEREQRHRRPGRAVNHDCCDSCKEGGDLICCDRCPAAFHLQCHDPPLNDEEVPPGEWLCHRCKVTPPENDDTSSTSSGHQPKGKCWSSKEKGDPPDEGGGGGGGAKPKSAKAPPPSLLPPPCALSDNDDEEDSTNPLKVLIKAAARMNPTQFNLPHDVACTLQLPGSSKRPRPKESKGWGSNKKPAHELDNGMVPLPAKLCFQCRKSCRKAPLIQCDFCPLLFHADCLDPPLTTLPNARWMCPNHPEHILDEKLLNSVSLTERVKLWDKFAGHISQDAVKVEFFKKVHRQNPPFRCKVRTNPRLTVQVPDSIRHQYECPPPLLPRHLPEPSPFFMESLLFSPGMAAGSLQQGHATPEEQEEWLSGVVSLQTSIAKYLAKKQLSLSRTSDCDSDVKMEYDEKDSKPLLLNGAAVPSGDEPCKQSNGPLVDEPLSANSKSETKTNSALLAAKGKAALKSGAARGGTSTPGSVSLLLPRPQSSPAKAAGATAASTTKSQVATIGTTSKMSIANSLSTSPAILNLNSSLQSGIEGSGDVELSKLDSRLIHILAWQRLQQLLPGKSNATAGASVATSVGGVGPQPKKGLNGLIPSGSHKVQARAMLSPMSGKGPLVSMPYRTLTIGTGADMDVCLASYGHCNFISSKHACIFYDEITKHYEVLNYSEHGTTVDNVLYSCDFSEKRNLAAPSPPTLPTSAVVNSVRKLVSKAKGRNKSLEPDTNIMSSKAGQSSRSCNCKTSNSTLIGGSGAGWEGTAILHHGSFLKCGCLQFVFSITDYSTKVTDTSLTNNNNGNGSSSAPSADSWQTSRT